MTAHLERADKRLVTATSSDDRYRRLTALYPRAYREAHGAVIRGTLCDAADARGGNAPAGELVGVVAHAVRLRLGLTPDAAVGRVVVAAAPLATGSAVALSVVLLIFGEWAPWIIRDGHYHLGEFGPFFTLGSVVYLAWATLALLALAMGGSGARQVLRAGGAVTVLACLAVVPASAVTGYGRPPMFVLVTLILLGLLVAVAPPDIAQPAHQFGRIAVGVGTGLAVALSLTALSMVDRVWFAQYGFYYEDAGPLAAVIPVLATFALLGTALACRSEPRWIAAVVVSTIAWAPYSLGTIAHLASRSSVVPVTTVQAMILPAWAVFMAVAGAVAVILYRAQPARVETGED